MRIEGLTQDMGPVNMQLSRLVIKDVHGNIIGFFHDGPDGISITCSVIGDEQFQETIKQWGIDSTTIVDQFEPGG